MTDSLFYIVVTKFYNKMGLLYVMCVSCRSNSDFIRCIVPEVMNHIHHTGNQTGSDRTSLNMMAVRTVAVVYCTTTRNQTGSDITLFNGACTSLLVQLVMYYDLPSSCISVLVL